MIEDASLILPTSAARLPTVMDCVALFRSIQGQCLPSQRQWQGHLDQRFQRLPKNPPNLSYFGAIFNVLLNSTIGHGE